MCKGAGWAWSHSRHGWQYMALAQMTNRFPHRAQRTVRSGFQVSRTERGQVVMDGQPSSTGPSTQHGASSSTTGTTKAEPGSSTTTRSPRRGQGLQLRRGPGARRRQAGAHPSQHHWGHPGSPSCLDALPDGHAAPQAVFLVVSGSCALGHHGAGGAVSGTGDLVDLPYPLRGLAKEQRRAGPTAGCLGVPGGALEQVI